jgi:hypothetical protein
MRYDLILERKKNLRFVFKCLKSNYKIPLKYHMDICKY